MVVKLFANVLARYCLSFLNFISLPIFNENCNSQSERAVAVPAAGWTMGEASKKMQLFSCASKE